MSIVVDKVSVPVASVTDEVFILPMAVAGDSSVPVPKKDKPGYIIYYLFCTVKYYKYSFLRTEELSSVNRTICKFCFKKIMYFVCHHEIMKIIYGKHSIFKNSIF